MLKDEAMLQRAKEIYQMRMEGKQFKEIGSKYGISSARARQVFVRINCMVQKGMIPEP